MTRLIRERTDEGTREGGLRFELMYLAKGKNSSKAITNFPRCSFEILRAASLFCFLVLGLDLFLDFDASLSAISCSGGDCLRDVAVRSSRAYKPGCDDFRILFVLSVTADKVIRKHLGLMMRRSLEFVDSTGGSVMIGIEVEREGLLPRQRRE